MTVTYDFSSPVVMAALVGRDNLRIPLWPASVAGQENSGLMLVLNELRIELNIGYIPKISANISLPYEEGIALLNSEKLEYGYLTLEAQFGYVGSDGSAVLSPVYTGLVLKPEVSIGEVVTFDFIGEGVVGLSAASQGRGKPLTNVTREEAIKEFVGGPSPNNKRKIEVDFSEVKKAGAGRTAYQRMFVEKVPCIAAGYVSDWQMILRIVRESLCWMYYGGRSKSGDLDVLNIVPMDHPHEIVPKHTFWMFPGTNNLGPGSGIYPIFNFVSPTSAVYYPGSIRGAILKGIRDGDGEVFNKHIQVTDKDKEGGQPASFSGSGGGVPNDSELHPGADPTTQEGVSGATADGNNPENVSETVRGALRATLMQDMGVRVEIDTIGVPDLRPMLPITLKGLGTRFDYNYVIHELVHTIGTSGCSTNFVAYSGSGFFPEDTELMRGQKNNEPGTADAGAVVAEPAEG